MVEKRKSLALLLFSCPYGRQDADIMCRLADSALDQGYDVKIFLYGDGVHAQQLDQNPLHFLNIGDCLTKLAAKGADIKSCYRCSSARGYTKEGFDEENDRYPSIRSIDAVKIHTLYSFIDMVKDCDKTITFGGL